MSTATNATKHFVLVWISITSILLLLVDGFTLFVPHQQNQQRHGSLIIRSMVATNPLPSASSSFTDDEDDYDYDEIDNDNDEIDDLSSTTAAATTTMIQKQNQISQKPIRRYQSSKKEPLIAILGRPNVGEFLVYVGRYDSPFYFRCTIGGYIVFRPQKSFLVKYYECTHLT